MRQLPGTAPPPLSLAALADTKLCSASNRGSTICCCGVSEPAEGGLGALLLAVGEGAAAAAVPPAVGPLLTAKAVPSAARALLPFAAGEGGSAAEAAAACSATAVTAGGLLLPPVAQFKGKAGAVALPKGQAQRRQDCWQKRRSIQASPHLPHAACGVGEDSIQWLVSAGVGRTRRLYCARPQALSLVSLT